MTYEFVWDGLDVSGRRLYGPQPIQTRVGYVYDGSYQKTARFGYNGNGIPISGSKSRFQATLSQNWFGDLGGWDDHSAGLGGWNVNVRHAYDPVTETVYLGDGSEIKIDPALGEIVTVAGNGTATFAGADGTDATAASINLNGAAISTGAAVAPDGSLYFADAGNNCIRRVSPDGKIFLVAGRGTSTADGVPATTAKLNNPSAVAVGPDGVVYFSDTNNFKIRAVDPRTGAITTIAGTGAQGDSASPCSPANTCAIGKVNALAVASDGTVYLIGRVGSTSKRMRRVRDGIISDASSTSFGDATALVLGSDGSSYVSDFGSNEVLRVTPDGKTSIYVGTGSGGSPPFGDGGPATGAQINQPDGVAIGPDGRVYVCDGATHHLIRRVNSDGTIETVAGVANAMPGYNGEGLAANRTTLNRPRGVAVGSDGILYILDTGNNRIRKVVPPKGRIVLADGTLVVRSADGTQLYDFDSRGKHLHTRDVYTGSTIWSFEYDANGFLTSITDGYNTQTKITRNATTGKAENIVGPDGQTTVLDIDDDANLRKVSLPGDGGFYSLDYLSGGLLEFMRDPKLNDEGGTSYHFQYDQGRLISETDPQPATKILSKALVPNGWEITFTSPEKRVTKYRTEDTGTEVKRTVTQPDTTFGVSQVRSDGKLAYVAPNGSSYDRLVMETDGTKTYSRIDSDPSYGRSAAIVGEQLTVLPSGLSRLVAATRTPEGVSSTGTLTGEIATRVLAGKTWTTTFTPSPPGFVTDSPMHRKTYINLDGHGSIASSQVASLLATSLTPDDRGRLKTIGQGTRSQGFTYDNNGFVQNATDALSNTTIFEHELSGRVTKETLPGNAVVLLGYDKNGNNTSVTPPGQPAHGIPASLVNTLTSYQPPPVTGSGTTNTNYHYDLDRLLKDVTRPDGLEVKPDYDTGGRLWHIVLPTGTITNTYDPVTGKLQKREGPYGETVTYGYDGHLLTDISYAGVVGGTVHWGYDSSFRKILETVNGTNSISFGYDDDGLLTSAGALTLTPDPSTGFLNGTVLGSLPANSVTDTSVPNAYGEINSYTAKYGATVVFAEDVNPRDAMGRITTKTEAVQGESHVYLYTYYDRGWLKDVTIDGVLSAHYDYDANGNRKAKTAGATTLSSTPDDQDRIVSYGSNTYSFGANGELKSKTTGAETTQYTYDTLGNLTKVALPDKTIDYVVDGSGRRVGKKVDASLVQGFIWNDKLRIVAELDGLGSLVSRFVYGNRVNVPEYMVKGTDTYRLIADHLGSVRLVVRLSDGNVVQRIDYDEFGAPTNDTRPGFQPFGFGGGLYDPDSKLVRFGSRDYDAETGRWTSKDPLAFVGGVGALNFYAYSSNDPVNRFDLFGLADCAYYQQACQETSWWNPAGATYYCWAAPLVCKHAGDSRWSNCVRQCLQEFDAPRDQLRSDANTPGAGALIGVCEQTPLIVADHATCFALCAAQ